MRHASELSRTLTVILREVVTVILPADPELEGPARAAVERDVTRYVAGQIRSMPGFLRLPYQLALLGFDSLPLLRYGRRFRALPPAKRESYLALWNAAPISPMRDFVKLVRSTALLVFFDHPLVLQRLEEQRQGTRAPVAPHRAANE